MRPLHRLPVPRRRRTAVSLAAAGMGVVLVGTLLVQTGVVDVRARAAATAEPTSVAGATPSPAPTAGTTGEAATSPRPTPTAEPSSTPRTFAMPLVPVESFWSVPASIAFLDLSRFWSGGTERIAGTAGGPAFRSLVVAEADLPALTRLLGPPAPTVRALSVAGVKAAVQANPATLGLLEADDVSPDIRALAIDGASLFGSNHLADTSAWRLTIATPAPSRLATEASWTLAAGGDVNLDRRVYVRAVHDKMGPDYPWLGGTARISGYECCDLFGGGIIRAKSRTPGEAFRSRFRDADLAMVNLEGSAPNDYVYRPNSLVFTFDPELLAGIKNAGVDVVSLANNHIRNGGDQGILDTIANLDRAGIAHTGAGATPAQASAPVWLFAGGRKVAVLGYSAIAQINWATASHPGAAALKEAAVVADIRAAKAAGADVVIVMPHWGREFTYDLSAAQTHQAAAFVAAGADLVLGSHSHWVGGVQLLEGGNGPAFVDYSMGDLLFDLNHDSESLEAEVVTLTFVGTKLAQIQLDPTVMIGGAQVGLLDPATDGKPVIDAIRLASRKLGW